MLRFLIQTALRLHGEFLTFRRMEIVLLILLAAAFDGFLRSNLDLAFSEEASQNLCMFRSWTVTAGVFGMASAINECHILRTCLSS